MESATTTTHPVDGTPVDRAGAPPARGPLRVEGRRRSSALAVARDYVSLTKPRIIALLLLTTVATMYVADPSGPALSVILWTVLGGYLAAGGAGAINHYLDRERDARMARTRGRSRPAGSSRGTAWCSGLGSGRPRGCSSP
jgi:heme O synthase-like polyprenyltransferase